MSLVNGCVLPPTTGGLDAEVPPVSTLTGSRSLKFALLSFAFTATVSACAARSFLPLQARQHHKREDSRWKAPSVAFPALIVLQLLIKPIETFSRYKCFSLRVPVHFDLFFINIFFNQGPSTVAALFSNRHLSAYFLHGTLLHNCFQISQGALDAYVRDDSGPSVSPAPNSNIEPHNRIDYRHHKWHLDYLTGAGLVPLCERFQRSFTKRLATFQSDVAAGRVQEDNLMDIFRNILTGPSLIDSLLSPAILKQEPDFLDSFWAIHDSFRLLNSGLPRWLIPKSRAALAMCITTVKEWHSWARKYSNPNGDHVPSVQDDPYWGSKSVRERQTFAQTIDGFTHSDMGSHDVAFAWAAAHNTIPAIFWQLVDVFNNVDLLGRIREEADACLIETDEDGIPQFDIARLVRQPYLQAVYAETLRLRTHGVLMRHPQKQTQIDKWSVPGGSYIAISSTTAHMDSVVWASKERGSHPVCEFAPKRFLIETDENGVPKFSMSGLEGAWIPFGGGVWACPGRYFVKQQAIVTLAVLTALFDFKIPAMKDIEVSTSRFPFGVLEPKKPVCFSIRTRA